MSSPFPVLVPPPVQGLAVAYLAPLMDPVPVATRAPQPANTADVVNGFIRVETAGGALQIDDLLFNCSLIIMAYSNNSNESQAEINLTNALARAGAAQGTGITHPSLDQAWYVTYSRITGLPVKVNDPLVNMTRFRGLVSWRIRGNPPAD